MVCVAANEEEMKRGAAVFEKRLSVRHGCVLRWLKVFDWSDGAVLCCCPRICLALHGNVMDVW